LNRLNRLRYFAGGVAGRLNLPDLRYLAASGLTGLVACWAGGLRWVAGAGATGVVGMGAAAVGATGVEISEFMMVLFVC